MNSARAFVSTQATAIRLVVVLLAVAFVLIQTYKTPDLIIWTTVILLVALFIIGSSRQGYRPTSRTHLRSTTIPAWMGETRSLFQQASGLPHPGFSRYGHTILDLSRQKEHP